MDDDKPTNQTPNDDEVTTPSQTDSSSSDAPADESVSVPVTPADEKPPAEEAPPNVINLDAPEDDSAEGSPSTEETDTQDKPEKSEEPTLPPVDPLEEVPQPEVVAPASIDEPAPGETSQTAPGPDASPNLDTLSDAKPEGSTDALTSEPVVPPVNPVSEVPQPSEVDPLPNQATEVAETAPPVEEAVTASTDSTPATEGPPSGWNWGAFFLGWIWGIAHKVWVALLSLVPIVNLVMPFYLGAKGNELAWKAGNWTSVEEFKKRQKKWTIAGLIVFVLTIISALLLPAMIVSTIAGVSKQADNANRSALTQSAATENESDNSQMADEGTDEFAIKQTVSRFTLESGNVSELTTATFLKVVESKDGNPNAVMNLPAGYKPTNAEPAVTISASKMSAKLKAEFTNDKSKTYREFELIKTGETWKINAVRTVPAS